jgi:hypothetical protein
MGTQATEKRIVSCRYALADNRNSQSRNGRLFWRGGGVQSVAIVSSRLAKRVLLMGGPEVRGKLLHKLRR